MATTKRNPTNLDIEDLRSQFRIRLNELVALDGETDFTRDARISFEDDPQTTVDDINYTLMEAKSAQRDNYMSVEIEKLLTPSPGTVRKYAESCVDHYTGHSYFMRVDRTPDGWRWVLRKGWLFSANRKQVTLTPPTFDIQTVNVITRCCAYGDSTDCGHTVYFDSFTADDLTSAFKAEGPLLPAREPESNV